MTVLLHKSISSGKRNEGPDSHFQALGPSGLGIIRIAGVPNVLQLRRRLLPLAQQFAVRSCHTRNLFLLGSADLTSTSMRVPRRRRCLAV